MPNYVALVNGVLTEVAAATAGGGVFASATVNFTAAAYEGVFSLVDGTVTPSSNLTAISFRAVGDVDELEFDQAVVSLVPSAGGVTAFVQAQPGPVCGQYTLTYSVA